MNWKEKTESTWEAIREMGLNSVSCDERKQRIQECVIDILGGSNLNRRAEDEFVMVFEDYEDAESLYMFTLESGLVSAGEVMMDKIDEGYSVSFAPVVVFHKPEVIRAAIDAYYEQIEEYEDGAFESIMEIVGGKLDEATVAGAPKKHAKGNPFHDEMGRLSGPDNTPKKNQGSWSMGKTKLKVTGSSKNKKGGLMVKYGSTKRPCGRNARLKGKNIRCRDGAVLEDVLSLAFKNKKRYRDLTMEEMVMVIGLKHRYMTV